MRNFATTLLALLAAICSAAAAPVAPTPEKPLRLTYSIFFPPSHAYDRTEPHADDPSSDHAHPGRRGYSLADTGKREPFPHHG